MVASGDGLRDDRRPASRGEINVARFVVRPIQQLSPLTESGEEWTTGSEPTTKPRSHQTWRILGQHLDIRTVRILKSINIPVDQTFQETVEDNEGTGGTTQQDIAPVWSLDIIASGIRRPDLARVYVAAEASISAGNIDVSRAKTIQATTGTPTIPVVIAARIDPPQRALADQKGVRTTLHPE